MDVGGRGIEAKLYAELPPLLLRQFQFGLKRTGWKSLSGVGGQLRGF
jgi:hypothetical protein